MSKLACVIEWKDRHSLKLTAKDVQQMLNGRFGIPEDALIVTPLPPPLSLEELKNSIQMLSDMRKTLDHYDTMLIRLMSLITRAITEAEGK